MTLLGFSNFLAFSDIFGTNIIDLALILVIDAVYAGPAVLNEVATFSAFAGVLGIALTLIYRPHWSSAGNAPSGAWARTASRSSWSSGWSRNSVHPQVKRDATLDEVCCLTPASTGNIICLGSFEWRPRPKKLGSGRRAIELRHLGGFKLLKFIGGTIGIIFLIGLLVVIGLFALIF